MWVAPGWGFINPEGRGEGCHRRAGSRHHHASHALRGAWRGHRTCSCRQRQQEKIAEIRDSIERRKLQWELEEQYGLPQPGGGGNQTAENNADEKGTKTQRTKRPGRGSQSCCQPEPEAPRSTLPSPTTRSEWIARRRSFAATSSPRRADSSPKGVGSSRMDSLRKLVELGNGRPHGIRCGSDTPTNPTTGWGSTSGRSKNFRLDGNKVRADLHLNETSLQAPPQGGRALGEYVMHLADTDPGCILVRRSCWKPTKSRSKGSLPCGCPRTCTRRTSSTPAMPSTTSSRPTSSRICLRESVYQATELIDEQFAGQPREVVEARLRAFLDKYLDRQFGPADTKQEEDDMSQESDARIEKLEEQAAKTQEQLGSVTHALQGLTAQLSADRDEAKQREALADRAKRITALCAQCGVDAKQANDWIADESLSVEGVKDQLLARKFEQDQACRRRWWQRASVDRREVLPASTTSTRTDHQALGVTREEYVKMREGSGRRVTTSTT